MHGNTVSWLVVVIAILENVLPINDISLIKVFSSHWDPARGLTQRSEKPRFRGMSKTMEASEDDTNPTSTSQSSSPTTSLQEIPKEAPCETVETDGAFPNMPGTTVSAESESSTLRGSKRKRSNGGDVQRKHMSLPEIDALGRSIIYIDDVDFGTFHNILYFLYTGNINLQDQREEVDCPPEEAEGYPQDEVSPMALFQAADMYLIEPLRQQCFRYLVKTCTINNISSRLFDISVQSFEDLRKEYLAYMVKNFDKVKTTKEWREAILKMNDGSAEELKYQLGLLLEITTS